MKTNRTKPTDKPTEKTAPKSARHHMITVFLILAATLLLLYLITEVLSSRFSNDSVDFSTNSGGSQRETILFYDKEKFTDADRADYEKQIRDVYYKDKNGIESLLTDENTESTTDPFAALFARYMQAIKDGDSAAYASCFSPLYNSENGFDRFASGEESFPPQRLYDIHVEQLDSLYDETRGVTEGLFDVRYRIYKNSGDFRTDMLDDTAPLIFYVEESDGVAYICNIAYRYGNENS